MARSKRRSPDKIARSDASQQDGQPVSSGGGAGTVAVDPAGALDGDGSIPAPLAVKVDGSTIIINGSNELEATGGGGGVSPHATTHENGGSDEINVAGLSGVLADPQPPIIGATATTAVAGNDARLTNARTPTAHHASHENGGSDEISVAGLSGLLADPQTPLDGSVTLSKLSPRTGIPTGRVIGIPDGAALGDPQDLTFNQVMELVHGSTDGDIIIRSGGQWIRLAKGTDGQVLTLVSGEPGWAGLTVGSPGSLDLTNAQIQSGNTTPLDIVPAPGVGKVVIPISCTHYTNVTVSKAANPSLRLRWNGDTTDLLGATNMQLNSTGEWFRTLAANLAAVSLAMATFDPRNKSLQWSLSANTAVGAATGKVRLAYTIVDLN